MTITRREILKAGTVLVVAAAVPASVRRAFTAPSGTSSGVRLAWDAAQLQTLSRETFSAAVRSTFRVRIGVRRSVPARLVEVRDIGGANASTECFALRFRTTRRREPLPQDTYVLEHARLGRFPLFLVPMGTRTGGRQYEAIINRRRS
jgi:hypothetical protein